VLVKRLRGDIIAYDPNSQLAALRPPNRGNELNRRHLAIRLLGHSDNGPGTLEVLAGRNSESRRRPELI